MPVYSDESDHTIREQIDSALERRNRGNVIKHSLFDCQMLYTLDILSKSAE